jgi:hypothetical protein
MFLFGTEKIRNLIKCCIIVNCMYLILAQGSWRKAQGVFVSLTVHGSRRPLPPTINYKLLTINFFSAHGVFTSRHAGIASAPTKRFAQVEGQQARRISALKFARNVAPS